MKNDVGFLRIIKGFLWISIFLLLCGAGPCARGTIEWQVTDLCEDGYLIEYKFYDFENNLVWPSASTHYETTYYNQTYTHVLQCVTGSQVCFGGRTGILYWGVDVDGSKGCPDCCGTCGVSGYYEFNAVCSSFETSDVNEEIDTRAFNENFKKYDVDQNDLDGTDPRLNEIDTFYSGAGNTNARIVDDNN